MKRTLRGRDDQGGLSVAPLEITLLGESFNEIKKIEIQR